MIAKLLRSFLLIAAVSRMTSKKRLTIGIMTKK